MSIKRIKKSVGAAFCRPLAVFAALALSAMLMVGCGDDSNPSNGGNENGHNGTPGEPLVVGGQTYRTVIIGGKTWMAENLNRQTSGSWCYDDDPANCAIYGRLYTWDAAMSACPSGWRLPSDSDMDDLISTAGGDNTAGTKLRSRIGWIDPGIIGANYISGTDDFGYSALPGGMLVVEREVPDDYVGFSAKGFVGVWWWDDSEYHDDTHARGNVIQFNGALIYSAWYKTTTALSVRCVMD